MDDFGFDLIILNPARAHAGESSRRCFTQSVAARSSARQPHATPVQAIAKKVPGPSCIGDLFDDPNVCSHHCDSRSTSAEAVET